MKYKKSRCGCGKTEWYGNLGLEDCRMCLECKVEMHCQYDIISHYGHKQEFLKKGEASENNGLTTQAD